jgi:hypothetical protein
LEWADVNVQGKRADITFTAESFAPRYENHLASINAFRLAFAKKWTAIITSLISEAKWVCHLLLHVVHCSRVIFKASDGLFGTTPWRSANYQLAKPRSRLV